MSTDQNQNEGQQENQKPRRDEKGRWLPGEAGNPAGLWKPGQSGNPTGGNREPMRLYWAVRKYMAWPVTKLEEERKRPDLTATEAAALAHVGKLMEGNTDLHKIAIEREEGKVPQNLTIGGEKGPLVVVVDKDAAKHGT